jgi:hypothetical protein
MKNLSQIALALITGALLIGCGSSGGGSDGDEKATYNPQAGVNLAKRLTANKIAITQSDAREVILRFYGFTPYDPAIATTSASINSFRIASPILPLASLKSPKPRFSVMASATKYPCDYSGYQTYAVNSSYGETTSYYNCSDDGIGFRNGIETQIVINWAGYDYAFRIEEDLIESEPVYIFTKRTSGIYEVGLIGVPEDDDDNDGYADVTYIRNRNQTETITENGVTYTLAYANHNNYYDSVSKTVVEDVDFGVKYANGGHFAVYASAKLIDGGCSRPDAGKFGVGEGNITGSTAAKIRITYGASSASVDFLSDGTTPTNVFSGNCSAYNNWLAGS